jgi:hypothetical protein
MPANYSRNMKKFGRSLRLIVWLGAWMIENASLASSAEPPKIPTDATVPSAVSKALAQSPSQARMESLRAAVLQWATTDPQASLAWVQNFTKDFEQWQLTNAILGAWTQHEPIAAAAYALGLPPEKRRSWESLRQVVMFWSRNDPRATLAWVQKLTSGLEQRDLLNLTVSGWASREPEAAAAFAMAFPGGSQRTMLVQSAVSNWALSDPAAAFAFLHSSPPDSANVELAQEVIRRWGFREPAAALDHLDELPPASNRSVMRSVIVGSWAEKDPAAALQYALTVGDRERDELLYTTARGLAQSFKVDAAAKFASALPEGDFKTRALADLATALGPTKPKEAVALLTQLPPGLAKTSAVEFVALDIGRRDPREAMTLIDNTLPPGEHRDGVRANLIPLWAITDFDGAVAWLRNLASSVGRDRIASRLGEEWAQRDPQGAFAFMQSMSDSAALYGFQEPLAKHWAAADPKAARESVSKLPPGRLRDSWVVRLTSQLVYSNPRDVADLIATLSNTQAQLDAAQSLAFRWTQSDPTAAATWAAALPVGAVRNFVVPRVALTLFETDREAAFRFVRPLPSDFARDDALKHLIVRIEPPELAAEWLPEIRNDQVRNETIISFASAWLQRDRAAAETWLEKQSLSALTLQRIHNAR